MAKTALFGIVTVCSFLSFGGIVSAQSSGPIGIGLLYSKQGPGAAIGQFLERGSELAVDEAGGKVLGRPIKLFWLDESNPQASQQNMQRLIEEDKVVAVVGGNYSSDALAMMSIANRDKIPLILPGAAASEITGADCNRYTFRTQAPVPVQMRGLMPYVGKIGKKIYFLTPSYAFGQDILRSGRSLLKSIGATEVGSDQVPIGTSDYTSYLLKIRQARPDVIVGGLVGGDFSNFLKQAYEMGMKGHPPYAAVAVSDTDFWDVGPKASAGIYVKPWYYDDPNNSPAENKMTAQFEARYNQPPSDKTWSGWIAMRALLDSIATGKSTDPKAIVTSLEHWRDMEEKVPFYFSIWDHQLVRPSVIVQVKSDIASKWNYLNVIRWTTDTEASTARDFGTEAESTCKMPPL